MTPAILSTHRDARFITVEQEAVRAVDLAGLAADYRTFYQNTVRLKQEHELLTGRAVRWAEWRRQVGESIRHYLRQEIRLTRMALILGLWHLF